MLGVITIVSSLLACAERKANEPNPAEISPTVGVLEVRSTDTPGPTVVHEVPEPEGASPTPNEESAVVDTPSPNPPTPTSTVDARDTFVIPGPEAKGWCCFVATRYGESYEGRGMGCPGYTMPAGRPDKLYHSADSKILAAPPAFYKEWECGKYLLITNMSNGRQLVVVRVDSCPGCSDSHIDLSEAGMAQLCGVTYPQTCDYLPNLMVQECKEENIIGSCWQQ